MELLPLESAVLEKLLDGEHPVLAVLRRQLVGLEVSERSASGVGFFAELKVDPQIPPAPFHGTLGDVELASPSLKHGAGFVLFVRNGYLGLLEGYTYDEAWPEQLANASLYYHDPDNRNLPF